MTKPNMATRKITQPMLAAAQILLLFAVLLLQSIPERSRRAGSGILQRLHEAVHDGLPADMPPAARAV